MSHVETAEELAEIQAVSVVAYNKLLVLLGDQKASAWVGLRSMIVAVCSIVAQQGEHLDDDARKSLIEQVTLLFESTLQKSFTSLVFLDSATADVGNLNFQVKPTASTDN